MRFLAIGFLFLFGGCHIDTEAKLSQEPTNLIDAQTIDVQKICKSNADCSLINQNCCGEKDGFTAINIETAKSITKTLSRTCENKLLTEPGLCKDKTRVMRPDFPVALCENNLCIIKTKAEAKPAADRTACARDSDCFVFDKSCCNTNDDHVVANLRASHLVRHEKNVDCREKLKADPRLCYGRIAKPRFPAKIAKCVSSVCTLL